MHLVETMSKFETHVQIFKYAFPLHGDTDLKLKECIQMSHIIDEL